MGKVTYPPILLPADVDAQGHDITDLGSVRTENISIILKAVLPKYDDLANAPAESGSVVWITGAGADPEGAYRYDGADWKGLGAGSLTDADLDAIVGFDLGAHVDRHTPETAADPISALTQAQMEGTEPPAQLSAYPLVHGTDTDVPSDAHHTASDHEDGGSLEITAEDLATALADGKILEASGGTFVSADKGANVPNWVLIDSYEDTDTGTVFDYDSGIMTQYDRYMVVTDLQNHTASTAIIYARINGLSAANYGRIAEGGVSTTGTTEWILHGIDANESSTIAFIGTGSLLSNPTAPRHGYSALEKITIENSPTHGVYEADVTNVNQYRVWVDQNCTGRIKVYGMNY